MNSMKLSENIYFTA